MAISLQVASAVRVTVRGTAYLPNSNFQSYVDARVAAAVLTGAELANFTPDGSGVVRSIRSKLRETLTALDYGASGDATADDSAAFALLEADFPGATVNLLGRVYLVTAEPEGAQYYNGAFKVGSTIYTRPAQPLAHPLDGQVSVSPTATGGLQHPWVGPQGVFAATDRMVRMILPDSTRHEVDVGGRVLMESSFSGGASWFDPITVYHDDTYEARGLVGGMTASDTRFVAAWLNVDAAGSSENVRYAFSTNGTTFTGGVVATGADVFYPHGDAIEDASGNVYIFGVRGGTALVAAKGVWGGSDYTWTVTTIATIGAGSIAEPVAFLTASGWVFLIRNDAGGNAYGLKCNLNFSSPSSFADSGVPLGLNPAAGVKAWGRGHVYLTARRSTPILSYQNVFLHAAVDLDALWTAGGVFPSTVAWKPVARLDDFGLGYLTICKLRGGYWQGLYGEFETLVGTSVASISRLVRIGGLPIALSPPGAIATQRTVPPLQYNPGLQHWTRATSFTCSAGVATKTADGLIVTGSGADVTVAREVVAEALRDRLSHRPYYCARVTSTSGGSGRIFARRIYGREQIERLARQPTRLNFQFGGNLPGYYRFKVEVNFGSGGSASVNTFVDATQANDGSDDLIWISEFLSLPSVDGKTFGTLPYIEFTLLANDAGAVDAAVYGFWADLGATQIPLLPTDPDADRALIDRHIQKREYAADDIVAVTGRVSDDVGVQSLPISPVMVREPVISLPSGTTAASFYVNSAANTLTDFSFDGLGTATYRLRAERTGAFTANTQEIRCVATGSILFDAEPAP